MDLGYDVTDVYQRDDQLTYANDINGMPPSVVKQIEDQQACDLMEAEVAYQDQNVETGAAREALFAEFAECMDEAGVDVTPAVNRDSFGEKLYAISDAGGDNLAAQTCFIRCSARLFGASGEGA